MNPKDEVISFKVDANLAQQIKNLPNRSEFIRDAILKALDAACPLCHGKGLVSQEDLEEWEVQIKQSQPHLEPSEEEKK